MKTALLVLALLVCIVALVTAGPRIARRAAAAGTANDVIQATCEDMPGSDKFASFDIGISIRVTCPEGNKCKSERGVYGTPERYATDSKLCLAAIHQFGPRYLKHGRVLMFRKLGIECCFASETRYGITSEAWNLAPWEAIKFDERGDVNVAIEATCSDLANSDKFSAYEIGDSIQVICPTGNKCKTSGKVGVWGNPDRYTEESGLCKAALHQFGPDYLTSDRILIFSKVENVCCYTGATRHGITSADYQSSNGIVFDEEEALVASLEEKIEKLTEQLANDQ